MGVGERRMHHHRALWRTGEIIVFILICERLVNRAADYMHASILKKPHWVREREAPRTTVLITGRAAIKRPSSGQAIGHCSIFFFFVACVFLFSLGEGEGEGGFGVFV